MWALGNWLEKLHTDLQSNVKSITVILNIELLLYEFVRPR
jgi:hypothetical protein